MEAAPFAELPVRDRPETVSAADAIHRLLREMILDGRLAPGTRLREVDVAERLGVSRTPLREAFVRLAGERLIRRRGAGVEVGDTWAELEGIRHIRMALEGYATRLAASRLTEADFDLLEASVQRSASLPYEALQERVATNTEFHSRIYQACGVPRLVTEIEKYSEYFMSESELKQLDREQSRTTVHEHGEIVAALRARDAGKAENLIRSHLLDAFNKSVSRQENGR